MKVTSRPTLPFISLSGGQAVGDNVTRDNSVPPQWEGQDRGGDLRPPQEPASSRPSSSFLELFLW